MRSRSPARATAHALAVVAGYVGAIVWLTWPLATVLRTALPATNLPCRFDLPYSAWVLAHDTRALVGDASLANANIYHPAPDALFYGPAAFGALPTFAPVFLATADPTLAINVTFLLGLALTASAMHLVVRRWTGFALAGVVAAAMALTNPWLLAVFVPTAPHWAALYCMPLIAYVAATWDTSRRPALRLVPLVVLQCLTDVAYLAPAVLAPLGVLLLLRLCDPRRRRGALRLAGALVVSAAALLPVVASYQAVRAANPRLATQTNWAGDVPPAFFPGVFVGAQGWLPFEVTPVAAALVAAGALVAVARRRRRGTWPPVRGGWAQGVLWTIVCAVLSLGPTVLAGGQVYETPLGYAMQWVPALQAIRVPARIGIGASMGLAILCGVAFGEIAAVVRGLVRRRLPALLVSAALAAVVVVTASRRVQELLPIDEPYPSYQAPAIPAAFVPLLDATGTPLLEAPIRVARPADPYLHASAMYHSIGHWRPLLNGYSSYWPVGFPERMAVAARLPDATALATLVDTTGLSMIWLHARRMPADQLRAWLGTSAAPGAPTLELVARADDELLFAVRRADATDGR